MEANEKESLLEVQEYITALENCLSEYTGFTFSLATELSSNEPGTIDLGFSLNGPINYPYLIEFGERLVSEIIDILMESINKNEELDWEMFYKLKEKLSLSFIFGVTDNKKVEHKRLNFLRDLIFVGNKTYESAPANIGVIYCKTSYLNILKDRYNCEILILEDPINIRDFFIKEKPFLRIIDGETLNLIVNEEFLVIGLTRNISNNGGLSQHIIEDFNKARLEKNKKAVITFLLSTLDKLKQEDNLHYYDGLDIDKKEQIVEAVINAIKEGVLQTKFEDGVDLFELIYFRMENKRLSIYNKEDFIITCNNGEWKIKNYHLLQYIILQYAMLRTHIYLALEDHSKDSKIWANAVQGTNIIINTIESLAGTHSSSIIMFVSDRLNNPQVSYSLTEQEAKELLSVAPLKKRDIKNLYLEVIKNNGNHLNLMEVNEKFLSNICVVDGALVLDDTFNILSYGEVIDVSSRDTLGNTFGTGTNACEVASTDDLAIKVSEDGEIKVYLLGNSILNI